MTTIDKIKDIKMKTNELGVEVIDGAGIIPKGDYGMSLMGIYSLIIKKLQNPPIKEYQINHTH